MPLHGADELRATDERIARLNGRLVRAREDAYDEKMGEEEFAALTARAALQLEEEKRRRLMGSVQPQQERRESFEEAVAPAGRWSTMLRDERVDVAARRGMLAELIERVEPQRVAYGQFRANITKWTDSLRVYDDDGTVARWLVDAGGADVAAAVQDLVQRLAVW